MESYALKKALAKRVTEIYISTGIFTEFSRADSLCTVKKSKNFKQAHFLRDIKSNAAADDSVLGTSLGFQNPILDESSFGPEERKAKE